MSARRGGAAVIGPFVFGLALVSLLSCRDELQRPVDVFPPAAVEDLAVTSVADSSAELSWTNSGDDNRDRQAAGVEVRALLNGAITSEAAWEAASPPPNPPSPPGAPGTRQSFRFGGLLPDSEYGFAVRLTDDAGNRSPLSNSPTARTQPAVTPEQGRVAVHLRSHTEGGYLGARISWGDSVLVASTADSVYTFPLPDGSQAVRVDGDCLILDPSAPQTVEIIGGETAQLDWWVDPVGRVFVDSDVPGAEIWLDDADTGLRTPTVLECLEPGSHILRLELPGVPSQPGFSRALEVSYEDQEAEFELVPRGVLMELFTATLCPNCPYADAAADSLWHREDLTDRGFVGLEVHNRWGGSDPFYNSVGTQMRTNFYGTESGIPIAMFNGIRRVDGAGSPPSAAHLAGVYADIIQSFQNGEEGSTRVGLYWTSGSRTPGQQVRGTLRVVLLEDLAPADSSKLWAVDYKDELTTAVPGHGDETFHHVAREFRNLGNLTRDLDLHNRGDFRDVEVAFDISWDTRWPEDFMGLVGFVQDPVSKEIDQMAHLPLP